MTAATHVPLSVPPWPVRLTATVSVVPALPSVTLANGSSGLSDCVGRLVCDATSVGGTRDGAKPPVTCAEAPEASVICAPTLTCWVTVSRSGVLIATSKLPGASPVKLAAPAALVVAAWTSRPLPRSSSTETPERPASPLSCVPSRLVSR